MKILFVATVQSHICQFHRPLASMLHAHGAEIHVAARNNLAEKNGLALGFVEQVFDVPFARSPKSKDNMTAYRQLKKIIDEGHYDVVHCNTPMGGIVARLAARHARKQGTKVYYTAHGFHFYKGASKKNWLVFYPIEKWFAEHYTDKVITITREDYTLAKNKFHTEVCHIHGVGANSSKYYSVTDEEKANMRKAGGYDVDAPVVLCVGELNKNKNQATAIRVMNEVIKIYPNSKLLLAGNGPSDVELKGLAQELRLEKNVEFLGYTLALDTYLHIADVAISLSFREGLPFNIMEAMLCKRPVIASDNRGHRELIEDGKNGFLVSTTDISEIAGKVVQLLRDPDEQRRIAENAVDNIKQYTDTAVEEELKRIYEIQ